MTWNEGRGRIGALFYPQIDENTGAKVWYVSEDQLAVLEKQRSLEMLEAVQIEARSRGIDPNSLPDYEISQIARKQGGKVYVNGSLARTDEVTKGIRDLLESKANPRYPKIKVKKDSARKKRTEMADAKTLQHMDTLDIVAEARIELDASVLNAKSVTDIAEARDLFDAKMERLFRARSRGQWGEYDPEQFDRRLGAMGWVEGMSREDYEKTLRTNYSAAQAEAKAYSKATGAPHDAGHGAPDSPNAVRNMAPQLSSDNRSTVQWYVTGDGETLDDIIKANPGVAPKEIERMIGETKGFSKADFKKLREGKLQKGRRIKIQNISNSADHTRAANDLLNADVPITGPKAFEAYLTTGRSTWIDAEGIERSVIEFDDFTAEDMNLVLHDPSMPSAESAKFRVEHDLPERQQSRLSGIAQAKRGKTFAGQFSEADAYGRLALAAGTGDLVGGTLATGEIAIRRALENPTAQKNIMKQMDVITKAVAKRAGKSGLKMVPGLGIALSAMESASYLQEGKLDQAGIAALSGAIGWVPIIGTGAAAALDLTNTAFDIARADIDALEGKKKKPEVVAIDKKTISKVEVEPIAKSILKQFKEGSSDALRITKGL